MAVTETRQATATRTEKGISLARGPALILGTILLAAGLYFLYKQHNFPKLSNFPNGSAPVDGYVFFGIFGANGWTGMLTAVAGGLLLFGAAQHLLAKTMSLIVGIGLGAAAIIGAVSGNVLGLAACNGWTELGWAVAAAILLFNVFVPRRRRTVAVADGQRGGVAGPARTAAPVATPAATRTAEPVATRRAEPVATRRADPLATRDAPAVAEGTAEPVTRRRDAPAATPAEEAVPAREAEPAATPGEEAVAAREAEPVATPRNEAVAADETEPVATSRDEAVAAREAQVPGARARQTGRMTGAPAGAAADGEAGPQAVDEPAFGREGQYGERSAGGTGPGNRQPSDVDEGDPAVEDPAAEMPPRQAQRVEGQAPVGSVRSEQPRRSILDSMRGWFSGRG